MITNMRDFKIVAWWVAVLLVAATCVNLIAIKRAYSAPPCVVTDNNPCSAPRGPWGR